MPGLKTHISLPFTLVIALAGCASGPPSAMLTYQTVPAGAELYEGGKSIGMEPVARTYRGTAKSKTIQTPDVKAVWPSGAVTTYFTYLDIGADRLATLERPAGAPGLQTDLEHARLTAATRKREAERLKANQKSDIARASDRCKAQQSGHSLAVTDDCN